MNDKDTKTSLLESIQRDVELTTSNYAQMHERLRLRDKASKFFVTYYSVFAILFSLIPFFFAERIEQRASFDFLTISISIVVLVASLFISLAKYSERALRAVEALDNMKRLKKELSIIEETDLWQDDCAKYKSYVKIYHQIVDCMELRTDIDYYRTCKNLSIKKEYKDRWDNLSQFNKFLATIARIAEYLIYTLLVLFPFIALWWCF